MSIKVNAGGVRPSTLYMSYSILGEKEFSNSFGVGKAKQIGTDDGVCLDKGSITSFEIGDCITVFGIEKIQGCRDSIMGCHISDKTSIHGIKKMLKEYANTNNDYDLYIIGGTKHTTACAGCLLENIHIAIKELFKGKIKIVQELVNLNIGTKYTYIDANLNIDGSLFFCRY